MISPFCRVAVLGLALAGFALAPFSAGAAGVQQQPNPLFEQVEQFRKEVQELNLKIDQLHRRTPFCDPAEEERSTRVWAERAVELTAIDVKSAGSERLRLTDGRPMSVMLDRQVVSGRVPYEKVHAFLSRLMHRNQLTDLETLQVKAEAGGTVSFTARLAMACYKEPEEEAELWNGIEEAMAGLLSSQRETYQKLVELTERSDTARFVQALAAFQREIGEQPVTLTEARFGEEVVLQGVVHGAAARSSLEPALEKAGFGSRRVQTSPAGACETFSVTARLEAREHPSELVSGNGLFENAPQPCAAAVRSR